jgi:hypothetical protein
MSNSINPTRNKCGAVLASVVARAGYANRSLYEESTPNRPI